MANDMKVEVDEEFRIGEVQQFPMSTDNIIKFSRINSTTYDCVPTALAIMGLIHTTSADLLRIVIDGVGITKPGVERIFSYLLGKKFKFFIVSQLYLEKYCLTYLKPNHVVFCGYSDVESHVYLIGNSFDGRIVLLDGTGTVCDITNNPSCYDIYKGKKQYYLLGI